MPAEQFRVRSIHVVQTQSIFVGPVLVEFHAVFEIFQILSYAGDQSIKLFHFFQRVVKTVTARRLAADKVLPLALQSCDLLFQTCFFQQVGIARQYGDILGEVHAASLVHTAFVDGTHSHPVLFELADEELFVVQQIELVGVERLFSERIEQKIFHAEIVVDSEKVKAEMSRYEKIPVITVFTDTEVNDRMDETIKQNYDHIKDETSQIVEKKLERLRNDPVLCKLLFHLGQHL